MTGETRDRSKRPGMIARALRGAREAGTAQIVATVLFVLFLVSYVPIGPYIEAALSPSAGSNHSGNEPL